MPPPPGFGPPPPPVYACLRAGLTRAECTDAPCGGAGSECPAGSACQATKPPQPPCFDAASPWAPFFAAFPPPPFPAPLPPHGDDRHADDDAGAGHREPPVDAFANAALPPVVEAAPLVATAGAGNLNFTDSAAGVGAVGIHTAAPTAGATNSNSNTNTNSNAGIAANSSLVYVLGIVSAAVVAVLAIALLVSRESKRRRDLLMTEFEARIAAKQGNATATTTTPRDSDLSSLPGLKSLPRTARISKLAPMSPLPPLPSSHIAIAPIPGFSTPVTYADDFFDDDSVSGGGGNTTPMSPALSEGSSIYAEDVRVVSAIEGLFFVDETGDLEASIKSSRNSGSSEKQGGASNSVGLGLRRAMQPKQVASSGFGEKKGLATRSGVHDFRQFGANLKILEEGQEEGVATSTEGGLVRLDSVGVARNVNVVDVALPGSGTAEIVDL